MSEPLSWTPYPCKIDGETAYLVRNPSDRADLRKDQPELDPQRIGLLALALFWKKSQMDYLAVGFINEEGEEGWTRMFENYEMMDWMAGFVLPPADQFSNKQVSLDEVSAKATRERDLRAQHRANQTFAHTYGWAPDIVIEWEPTAQEQEAYAETLIGDALDDDEHLHQDLAKALETEF